MSYLDDTPIVRLNWDAPTRRRSAAGGKGRPYRAEMIFAVRQLVEGTTLTYAQIAKQTGVGRASISRWKQDEGWRRPEGAPVATDAVGGERGSHRLRARQLHRRAQDIAERYLAELEASPEVDLSALNMALEMLKAAKLARIPRKRRPGAPRPPEPLGPPGLPPAMPRPKGRPGREPSKHLPHVREAHRRLMADLRRQRTEEWLKTQRRS